MSELAIVATHLGAFALGVGTWLPFTLWAARRAVPVDVEETPPVSTPARPPTARASRVLVAVMVAALLLVGVGVQQRIYQARADDRDACVTQWGTDMVDTITTRVQATNRTASAAEARDDAVDAIVLVFIALRKVPPAASERDLSRVLAAFAAAKSRLDRVRAMSETTRAQNPYPQLDC